MDDGVEQRREIDVDHCDMEHRKLASERRHERAGSEKAGPTPDVYGVGLIYFVVSIGCESQHLLSFLPAAFSPRRAGAEASRGIAADSLRP